MWPKPKPKSFKILCDKTKKRSYILRLVNISRQFYVLNFKLYTIQVRDIKINHRDFNRSTHHRQTSFLKRHRHWGTQNSHGSKRADTLAARSWPSKLNWKYREDFWQRWCGHALGLTIDLLRSRSRLNELSLQIKQVSRSRAVDTAHFRATVNPLSAHNLLGQNLKRLPFWNGG